MTLVPVHSGTVVVKYTYDAWGKILSITGSKAGTIGIINPLRYRSYVYDEETGLYYPGGEHHGFSPYWKVSA